MVRRRRVLGGVILAAAAVLGFGALEWREIAVRWRLAELGRQGSESELPAALVDAAPGTVEWEVLGRYVRTPAGKERLLRSYLSLLESSVEACPNEPCAWAWEERPPFSSRGWAP